MALFKPHERHDENGAVSLEMALTAPLLLLFVAGIAGLGHALCLKQQLTAEVLTLARGCSLRDRSSDCRAQVEQQMQAGYQRWCDPLTVTLEPLALPQLERPALQLEASCSYSAGLGGHSLARKGVTFGTLRAVALVPDR